MLTVTRLDNYAVLGGGVAFRVVAECYVLDQVDVVNLTPQTPK